MTAGLVIDILLGIALVGAVLHGWSSGFFRVIGVVAGLALGAVSTYLVLPSVMSWVSETAWRMPSAILTTLVLLTVGAGLGAAIGGMFRSGVRAIRLGVFDRLGGSLASLAVGSLTIVLVSGSVAALGAPWLTPAVAESRIVQTIGGLVPAPVSTALSKARDSLVEDAPAWAIETIGGPIAENVEAPDLDTSTDAVRTATESIALISGNAAECGVNMTGTGFVVAPGRIVTNAHVVAGVDTPIVDLPNELPTPGRVVYWDDDADLAVIAIDTTSTRPLPIGSTLSPGSAAIVAGHPFGGPLTVGGASVIAAGPLTLRSEGTTVDRDAYTLAATVNKGNSGGPLLAEDGSVVGVIFGTSQSQDSVAFATTMVELDPVASRATTLVRTVDNGDCART